MSGAQLPFNHSQPQIIIGRTILTEGVLVELTNAALVRLELRLLVVDAFRVKLQLCWMELKSSKVQRESKKKGQQGGG